MLSRATLQGQHRVQINDEDIAKVMAGFHILRPLTRGGCLQAMLIPPPGLWSRKGTGPHRTRHGADSFTTSPGQCGKRRDKAAIAGAGSPLQARACRRRLPPAAPASRHRSPACHYRHDGATCLFFSSPLFVSDFSSCDLSCPFQVRVSPPAPDSGLRY